MIPGRERGKTANPAMVSGAEKEATPREWQLPEGPEQR